MAISSSHSPSLALFRKRSDVVREGGTRTHRGFTRDYRCSTCGATVDALFEWYRFPDGTETPCPVTAYIQYDILGEPCDCGAEALTRGGSLSIVVEDTTEPGADQGEAHLIQGTVLKEL